MNAGALPYSFASRALMLGVAPPDIGKLLGHNDIETMPRYVHLVQNSLDAAAKRIAESTAADVL